MNIFSVDGPLYKFMQRLWDMFKLNFMWVLCSLPIVTMGAATTAAYTVTLKMVKDEEGYVCKPFLIEFKRNLKKGSILGIIFELACYAIYLDFQLFQKANHSNLMFLIVGILATYLVIMHFIFAFALLARYENSVINTLRNSYSIASKFFGRTLFLIFLIVFEIAIILFNHKIWFIGIFFGPACIILTISGFARQFFMLVEQDNDIKADNAKKASNKNESSDTEDEMEEFASDEATVEATEEYVSDEVTEEADEETTFGDATDNETEGQSKTENKKEHTTGRRARKKETKKRNKKG